MAGVSGWPGYMWPCDQHPNVPRVPMQPPRASAQLYIWPGQTSARSNSVILYGGDHQRIIRRNQASYWSVAQIIISNWLQSFMLYLLSCSCAIFYFNTFEEKRKSKAKSKEFNRMLNSFCNSYAIWHRSLWLNYMSKIVSPRVWQ